MGSPNISAGEEQVGPQEHRGEPSLGNGPGDLKAPRDQSSFGLPPKNCTVMKFANQRIRLGPCARGGIGRLWQLSKNYMLDIGWK